MGGTPGAVDAGCATINVFSAHPLGPVGRIPWTEIAEICLKFSGVVTRYYSNPSILANTQFSAKQTLIMIMQGTRRDCGESPALSVK